ncbi:uncharacterized protein A4U43_C01F6520 [Asparagus officinalis]|uniref:Uncharacterized protein n=1 Tax=Asparagus officinalis TaxID=4686 RepID=A0A5P1FP00_ASPOF|nr:uncharacterized protein A4U43_C01F6520 [Asparagus officinalis]
MGLVDVERGRREGQITTLATASTTGGSLFDGGRGRVGIWAERMGIVGVERGRRERQITTLATASTAGGSLFDGGRGREIRGVGWSGSGNGEMKEIMGRGLVVRILVREKRSRVGGVLVTAYQSWSTLISTQCAICKNDPQN